MKIVKNLRVYLYPCSTTCTPEPGVLTGKGPSPAKWTSHIFCPISWENSKDFFLASKLPKIAKNLKTTGPE
jgi:hypothetical protein